MRNLKNNKAAGTDGIYLQFIKYRGNKLSNELLTQIWGEESIAEEWKETILVPIYKKGDTSIDRCENYRGNSIRKCSLQNFGEYNFGKN